MLDALWFIPFTLLNRLHWWWFRSDWAHPYEAPHRRFF